MANEGFKHKLAASLSADVEGYSRLMGEDEEAILSDLAVHRDLLSEIIRSKIS